MTGGLRIALVVPDYEHQWEDTAHCRIKELRGECRAGHIDLVVFPEAYDGQTERTLQAVADDWADYLDIPTLLGVTSDAGFETAVYRNPHPTQGETATHLYVKHSTAPLVAFQWPGYQDCLSSFFSPILLKGTKVAVQICHDMFFGLLGQRMKRAGTEVFIDLTGGGVNASKWSNVVRGRSLELQAPFLCTMAKRQGGSGVSRSFAFGQGVPLQPIKRRTNNGGYGGYDVYTVAANPTSGGGTATGIDDYSDKSYRDITLATSPHVAANMVLDSSTFTLSLRGRTGTPVGQWRSLQLDVGRVGVLSLGIDDLRDGRLLYQNVPAQGTFDHHVVAYLAAGSDTPFADVVALARLRAIEHRIAVVVGCTGRVEAFKTNRYKNIQRFAPKGGLIGLNAEFLGGTWSTASTTGAQGIPERFFAHYLSLCD